MSVPPPPRFEIVQQQPSRFPRWLLALLMFLLGLAVGGGVLWAWHKPEPGSPTARLAASEQRVREQAEEIAELRQREATLSRSEQISRDANRDVEDTLAEKDEEIAGLRADVAFYERFVGSSGPRKGLSVHSAEFAPEAGGSWRYEVVLTQSINRGGLTQGELRFAIEGVRGGKLTTLNWDELQQKPGAPGQHYSFRYFQRVGGSVILPPGFTAQRVKLSLRGNGANVDQTLAWTLKSSGEN